MPPVKTPKRVETAFSTYVLGPVIGNGGSGRVFSATDDAGKLWALKLLEPKLANSERRKRFKNEIAFCERTRHPNVIQVADHGVVDLPGGSAPFYVMPIYAGSLRKFMGQLGDPDQRALYFGQILNGIETAHLKGVIHRDIKPENILMDPVAKKLVVADFGIAHFTDEELYTAVETRSDARLANFLYAAPEQRIRGRNVDLPADIYALGLILNEIFTGQVPHGTAYKTISASIPNYAWLDPLVERMIRAEPEQRPESIDIIKRELIAYKENFVIRQRLDELQQVVVPSGEITDPLALIPPKLMGFDWNNGQLTLVMDKPVNEKWVNALHNMGEYASLLGKGPERFTFSGNKAVISARDGEVQSIIDYFKVWLPSASTKYRQMLESEIRRAEEQERTRIRAEQDELKRRQSLKERIKL